MKKRNTQPIHKSYPALCTQHVENSVERLGTTGGYKVTNRGTGGKRSHHPVGYPRFPHTDWAQISGPSLGRPDPPQRTGPPSAATYPVPGRFQTRNPAATTSAADTGRRHIREAPG